MDKTCSINQEFSVAHPTSKLALNRIYNCHFSGSQLWDIFSKGSESFISTYNWSIKVMTELPYATHRYLIEEVSAQLHMRITLMKIFLNFIRSIKDSKKIVLKLLYDIVKEDTRTTTGSNLRNILLLTDCSSVDQLKPSLVQNMKYKQIKVANKWRVTIIKEILDMKYGGTEPPDGWTDEEFDQILQFTWTE